MGQVLYATFLENRRVYRLAKTRWQRLFEQLLSAKQYTFRPFLNEKRMDGNPMFTAYEPAVDRAVRIIQVDPAEAVSEVDIKAWLDQAVMPEREDRVEELVIDLVLTNEAESLSKQLIDGWLVQGLSMMEMERMIDELVVIDEEVSGV
ncbi:MAG TPA: hypothetical protein PLC89_26835 [Haliscomenobacter sp.]|uniref:Uncharacterized protein n=1 Tax=Haliscomenobacter hydrossis (strain ATCC 27775 / DSM 1100 / LMG 10767 / O) TaxID=760192 RepID=F4KZB5_HALH1|nr:MULTISPECIES: hypothetical protein [Haliscomenobacter]AEE48410.1 hypothetical protein Halhy_0500 [Haliscomenobacter hydrossis DSM 1100]HOY20960.1 hypothetical protein [Haliscomenobacter sp.]